MKRYLFIIVMMLLALSGNALTLHSIATGPGPHVWSNGDNWSTTIGGSPIGGTLNANDNHTYNIRNGNIIDFNGYDPDGTFANNIIKIINGKLYSSSSFDNINSYIDIYDKGSIEVVGNFSTYYVDYFGPTLAPSTSITVGGTFTTTYLLSEGKATNYTINAQSINIANYNYYPAGALYQRNLFNTIFNITDPLTGSISITNFYGATEGSLTSNDLVNVANFYLKSDALIVQRLDADFNVANLVTSGFNNTSLKLYTEKMNQLTLQKSDGGTTLKLGFPFTVYGYPQIYMPLGLETQNSGDVFLQGDLYIAGVINTAKALGMAGYMVLTGPTTLNGNEASKCIAIGGDIRANGNSLNIGVFNSIMNIFGDALLSITDFPALNSQTNIFVEGNADINSANNELFNGGGRFTVLGNTIIRGHNLFFDDNSRPWFGSTGKNNITSADGGSITFHAGADVPVSGISNYTQCSNFSRDSLVPYTPLFPLPIELLNFSAHSIAGAVEINWSTASELNNDFFTIYKSDNGQLFNNIASVSGAGNSTAVLSYHIVDTDLKEGINYYRLSQTDFDGTTKYFQPVSVYYTELSSFAVYPTVVRAESSISIKCDSNLEYSADLINLQGQIIESMISINNSTTMQLSSDIKPGQYFLKLSIGEKTLSQLITVY